METILRPPQWPPALSSFITWCLMWDPRNRPTSSEAMRHEYFADAVDPLRPKSSRATTKNKHMSIDSKSQRDSSDNPVLSTKPSWFRKSLIKDNPPVAPIHVNQQAPISPRPSPVHAKTVDVPPEQASTSRFRPFGNKRATWTNGTTPANGAPMPILPSIRPISPFSATVNAQSHNQAARKQSASTPMAEPVPETKPTKKLGRQLSVNSNGNHYADYHRQEAERALNGQRGPISSSGEQKEGFFSHLRKRARRLSGKPQIPVSPAPEDVEATAANAGRSPWHSNRNSMIVDSNMDTIMEKSFTDVDAALQSATYGAQPLSPPAEAPSSHKQMHNMTHGDRTPERHPSLSKSVSTPAFDSAAMPGGSGGPISSRTRRALHRSTNPNHMYDTPEEEDELLHEALSSAQTVARRMDRRNRAEDQSYLKSPSKPDKSGRPMNSSTDELVSLNPYPTPSPSAKRNGMLFDRSIMTQPVTTLNVNKTRPKQEVNPRWPTPPDSENEWAASASASIFAAGSIYN